MTGQTSTVQQIKQRMRLWFETAIYDRTHGVWNEDTMELVFIKLDELHHPLTARANIWAAAQYRMAVEIAFRFLRKYPDARAAKQLYQRVAKEFDTAEKLVLNNMGRPEEAKLYNFIQTQRRMCLSLLSRLPEIVT